MEDASPGRSQRLSSRIHSAKSALSALGNMKGPSFSRRGDSEIDQVGLLNRFYVLQFCFPDYIQLKIALYLPLGKRSYRSSP